MQLYQVVTNQWDSNAFKSVPMFFDVFVPLAALHVTRSRLPHLISRPGALRRRSVIVKAGGRYAEETTRNPASS